MCAPSSTSSTAGDSSSISSPVNPAAVATPDGSEASSSSSDAGGGGGFLASTRNRFFGGRSARSSLFLFGSNNNFGIRYKWKSILVWTVLGMVAISAISFTCLYIVSPGFRRTIKFWNGMAPIVIKYKLLKFKAKYLDGLNVDLTSDSSNDASSLDSITNSTIDTASLEEYKRRLSKFNKEMAPKLVNLILRMGGIYIKIGQVMSTIGQGLLPAEYINALQPLTDGVPPRNISDIHQIIESSTGKSMNDIFDEFDDVPVGSASIAQAHKAVLRNTNEQVIVKVQYPDVAKNFQIDLRNMEIATKWMAPDNMELVKALRERHERELDFNIEASNLVEVRRNMQNHGVEPSMVRIPRVLNETGLCSRHVLIMEYLDGVSLSDVVKQEQNRMARAMGKVDADEFRTVLAQRMREHFEKGGGGGDNNAIGTSGQSMKGLFGRQGSSSSGSSSGRMIQVSLPLMAKAFRTYVGIKERFDKVGNSIRELVGNHHNDVVNSDDTNNNNINNHRGVNLARVLKTLVYVHGLQMLRDGVYNADPHPVSIY